MDAEGFVPVSLIAQFNKVRNITQSLMVILDAALHSTVVEVQHDKIRRRHDGGRWQLLPGQTHPINVVNENISVRNWSEGGHRKHEQAQMVGLVSSSIEANSGTSKVPTISLADAHIPPPTSDRISHEDEHVMRDGKQEEECLNGAPLIFQGVPNIDSSSADVFFRRESCTEDNAVRSTDAVNGSLIHPRIQEDSNIGLQATADVKACFPEDPRAFWMENDYDFNRRSLKKECTQPIEPDSTLKL
ncbi:hypothetical protein KP509_1Z326200 [Ceratopteris richardii]|nr:hypothetical protein KP509_1Z326200 [Ceratopteris richardii]